MFVNDQFCNGPGIILHKPVFGIEIRQKENVLPLREEFHRSNRMVMFLFLSNAYVPVYPRNTFAST